jgi:hypothetical protein
MSQLAISAELRLIATNRVCEVLHIRQGWLGSLASRIILWGRSDSRDGEDSNRHRDLEVHQQPSTAIGQSIGSVERITSGAESASSIIASSGYSSAAERAADPLHRAWIHAKPVRDLAYTVSTPRRL